MTTASRIIAVLDAAAQVPCTLRLLGTLEPQAVEIFKTWCALHRHEMSVDDTKTYRLYSVSLISGACIAVGEIKR